VLAALLTGRNLILIELSIILLSRKERLVEEKAN